MIGPSAGLFPQTELAWVEERVNRMAAPGLRDEGPGVRGGPLTPRVERKRTYWSLVVRRAAGRVA